MVGDVVRRCHNGQCKDTLEGLPDLGIFCSTAEVSGFVKYQLLG
jgi:hypothetical protein